MISLDDLNCLKGRTALVTGGSAGLGRVCAQALASAGARVLIASRKAQACEAAAAELSAFGECEGFAGDVGTKEGVAALAREVGRRTGRLDILVNNAGATWGAPFEAFDWAAWDRVLSVNLIGLFTLTRDLVPLLEAAGTDDMPARVVNMGSTVGTVPIGQQAYSYAASKAAVHHLTRVLSNEFAARHITFNAIAPGLFETRMTAFAAADEARKTRAMDAVPMKRFGRPAELAATLLYLCGRGGSYTTGAVIPLDGGMSADAIKSMWEN